MRGVLVFLKWAGIFLLLCILAIIGLPWLPVAQDQLSKGRVAGYLEDEGVRINLEREDGGIRLPADIYAKRFIMLGEIHGFRDLQDFDLALLKHLHDKTGRRVYLAEINPAVAIAFNRMVLDGDGSRARMVFNNWSRDGAQWGNKEFFAKLEAIRDYNRTLPEDSRIVFVGVDKVGDASEAAALASGISVADEPSFVSTGNIRAINHDLLALSAERDESLGRYSNILPNIDRILSLPGAEYQDFYALWGLFHTSKVPVNGASPLALRLSGEGGAFEDNVATIAALCIEECFNMMPRSAVPGPFQGPNGERYTLLPMAYDNPYLSRVRGVGAARQALASDEAIVVPTTEEGSPFLSGPQLIGLTGYITLVTPFVIEGSAGEAFDAMILHRSSAGLTPWSGEAYDVSGEALAAE